MNLLKKRNPVEEWRRLRQFTIDQLHRRDIALNENDRQLLKLKNCHAGKRAFIFGNGPSLKIADMNLLKNEITFASNKVFLAFDQTSWRPTYYSVSDRLVALNNTEKIKSLPLRKILSDDIKEYFPDSKDVTWFREIFREGPFSTNFLVGSNSGATVVYHQLQLAFYMGITEAYILGVDFSFNVPPASKVNTAIPGYSVAIKSEGECNHFHPDYRKPGEVWGVPDLDTSLRSFTKSKAAYEAHGRKVVNCSRTTKLEVFPKATLESVLGIGVSK